MKLTKDDKVYLVSNCSEVQMAVKMLVALMEDAEIENFIKVDYEVLGQNYNLKFTKVKETPKDKSDIMDDLQEMQDKVDGMGFQGSNEHELFTRDLIADYIIKNFK